ncbi:MAG: D-alanine--D-alanine ligase [Clostridia bacterium]|nr:D-alanine--D-alanine ligase [Clostridia bacterium]
MKRLTLCVIFGGKSMEYEVSLRSAEQVLEHIDAEKYDVIRVWITREGKWYIFEGENREILRLEDEKIGTAVTVDVNSGDLIELGSGKRHRVDIYFPVMHGEYVEDGRLQGLFDICGAKYVGCGAFASHICMDKALAKDVARKLGIKVAKGVVLNAKCRMQKEQPFHRKRSPSPCTGEAQVRPTGEPYCYIAQGRHRRRENGKTELERSLRLPLASTSLSRWRHGQEEASVLRGDGECEINNPSVNCVDTFPCTGEANGKFVGFGEKMEYPVFVKPCMSGSSVGVSRVENEGQLTFAIENAFKYCDRVMIEEGIDGKEVEVAVMERGGELVVSPAGMIKYTGNFYGYEEKYCSGNNEYIIPAPVGAETEKYLRECAKRLFLELGCRGLSRFDFFVKKDGEVVFNEVNTMPGFTKDSMFPMLLGAAGLSYGEIIEGIVG